MSKSFRTTWPALLAMTAAILAVGLALCGFDPLEILTAAGPSLLLANGPVMLPPEVKRLIEETGTAFEEFKKRHNDRVTELEARLDEVQLKANRPGGWGIGVGKPGAEELKHLDRALRAWASGDQARFAAAMVEAKAMSAGSDPAGGDFVHPFVSTQLTQVMAEISPVYRLARRVPMDSGASFEEIVDTEDAAAHWVTEVAPRNDTATPQVKKFTVELHEVYAQPKITQKLIDTSSYDVVGWLLGKVGDAFALTEGVAFHTGDGVGKPRGFLSYPMAATADATRPWGTLQYVTTGVSGAFPTSSTTVNPADVLVDVQSALRVQYRQGAVWLMNSATAGVVRKLKDAEGRHVWVDSLQQGQPPLLLGHPVEIDEAMPDIGADAFAIAFGNLQRAYTIVEMPGLRFLSDPFTAKPSVRLFNYRRVGGAVHNSEAIKLLKFGTA